MRRKREGATEVTRRSQALWGRNRTTQLSRLEAEGPALCARCSYPHCWPPPLWGTAEPAGQRLGMARGWHGDLGMAPAASCLLRTFPSRGIPVSSKCRNVPESFNRTPDSRLLLVHSLGCEGCGSTSPGSRGYVCPSALGSDSGPSGQLWAVGEALGHRPGSACTSGAPQPQTLPSCPHAAGPPLPSTR